MIWFSGRENKYVAAVATAKTLGVPGKIIRAGLKRFKGLPHRLEFIGEKKGVKYINDSAATMPEAAVYALNSLKEYSGKIILIAGGVDKKLDYKKMAKEIKRSVKELILFPGSATDKILQENTQGTVTHMVGDMKEAVAKAKSLAKKGDVVLLSPGAASFNLFANEFDRGDQFKKLVGK